MFICIRSDEYGNFVLCKIKHLFIDDNFQKLFFFGNIFTVSYNALSGLYENYFEFDSVKQNLNNNFILIDYEIIICIEPVLMHNFVQSNEDAFYFKSEPYQKY